VKLEKFNFFGKCHYFRHLTVTYTVELWPWHFLFCSEMFLQLCWLFLLNMHGLHYILLKIKAFIYLYFRKCSILRYLTMTYEVDILPSKHFLFSQLFLWILHWSQRSLWAYIFRKCHYVLHLTLTYEVDLWPWHFIFALRCFNDYAGYTCLICMECILFFSR
jgi:hypothetical protein